MKVDDAIRTMRAVRQFTDQPISEADIHSILNAGRRAQSSKNDQPWQFIAVRNRDTLRQLSECGTYAGHLAGAALGVALVSAVSWAFDTGQAAAFMQLEAWSRGIGSCIASMWEPEKAKAILGVPEEMHFEIALSFGYPDPAEARPTSMRGRRSLDEVVRWEHW